MLFEATVGMVDKMGILFFENLQKKKKEKNLSWSSPEAKFLVWGLKVAQETWPLGKLS